MKKFNEFDKVNENLTTTPKIWNPEIFTHVEDRLIISQRRKGLKLYYLKDATMIEVTTNEKTGRPYRLSQTESKNKYGRPTGFRKTSLSENTFGVLYFLTDQELSEITPTTDKIKNVLELMEKKKSLLVDLIGSKIQEMGQKEDNNNEEV